MQDDNGFYYYPDPSDKRTRVYVRNGRSDIEFRLWRQDHPEVWDTHNWLPYDVVRAAALMYQERGTGADPLALYDYNVAKALLKGTARQ